MTKRALLVGCNYPGSNAALNGCINDVWGMKAMLLKYFGFTEADITVMIDTDKAYTQPTGKNIKAKLAELVQVSQSGDTIFFHFSGHGTQVPSDDPEEKDGKDEAICPTDMNIIADGDLRQIFLPLGKKQGVYLQVVADCCHSGTILDHDEVVITGPKTGGPPPPPVNTQAIQDMLASLGAKRDINNRSLPFNDLLSTLSQMLGTPVNQGQARASMAQLFGADASKNATSYTQYMDMAVSLMNAVSGGQQGGQKESSTGMIMKLLKMCMGGGQANTGEAYAVGSDATGPKPPKPVAGQKPPASDRLDPDVGVLITGCMDKETSADACPSGDKTKAFGALSHALQTTVAQHFAAHPGQPLTNRNLVIGVREFLVKSNFAQSPCLECSEKHADAPFICTV